MPNNYSRPRHGVFRPQRSRLVMEKQLERTLLTKEIVHHVNENKRDDDIDNLQLTNRSEHMKMHRKNWEVHRGNEYSREELIEKLKDLATKLGRTPKKREMLEPHFETYRKRFGTWNDAIRAAKLKIRVVRKQI